MNHRYRVFGLNVDSCIEIPELIGRKQGVTDVTICHGEVPDELENPAAHGVLYQAAPGQFLFKLDTVGKYLVSNGNKILFQPLNNSTEEEQRLFLLGSAFGALLHQRGLLPFHSSTVVKDRLAILIAGQSGTGKSTLAAELVNRGFRLLADDITVIDRLDDRLFAFPGIPHFKLWLDVLQKMGDDESGLSRVRPQLEKFKKPVRKQLIKDSCEVSQIILLSTWNQTGFRVQKPKGMEKFNLLKNNTYRFQFVEGLGMVEKHFGLISDLAAEAEVFQIKRPNSPLLIKELGDLAEKIIAGEDPGITEA